MTKWRMHIACRIPKATHTQTHSQNTNTLTQIQTHSHKHKHTHTNTSAFTQTHTHLHKHTHTNTNTLTETQTPRRQILARVKNIIYYQMYPCLFLQKKRRGFLCVQVAALKGTRMTQKTQIYAKCLLVGATLCAKQIAYALLIMLQILKGRMQYAPTSKHFA